MMDSGRYMGRFKGFVRDNDDPDKLGRVRCFCPAVMGNNDNPDYYLGWALPSFFFGNDGTDHTGSLIVPDLDTPVWIEFEQGNPDFPIYVGTWPRGDTEETAGVPTLGKGDSDGTEGSTHTIGGVTIPSSDAGSSTYPHNRVVRTRAGHVIEIDDTDGNKRIRVRHSDGSFLEFQDGGQVVLQVLADLLAYVAGDLGIAVSGGITLASSGNLKLGAATAILGVARETDDVSSGVLTGTVMVGAVPLPVTFVYTPVGGPPFPPSPAVTILGKIITASSKVKSV